MLNFWNIDISNNMNLLLLNDQNYVTKAKEAKSLNNNMNLHYSMTCRFAAGKKDEKMSECPYLEGAIKLLVGWSA